MSNYSGRVENAGPNRWKIILELGRDASGRRHRKTVNVRGTRKVAEAKKVGLLNQLNTGTYAESGNQTVGDFLQTWLSEYAVTSVAPKTYERYEEIVRLHLTPALGHLQLSGLLPMHIQSFYKQALTSGRLSGKGGLSPTTVRHFHRVLSEALARAVKWQLLLRNPADAVDPPRVDAHEVTALDEDGVAALIAATQGTSMQLPTMLAVSTGMRRGEVLGLRWSDVDLDEGALVVRASLEQTKTGLAFKSPKTNKSRRLPLTAYTVKELRIEKCRQAALRLSTGGAFNPEDVVVCTDRGELWKPNTFSSCFRTFAHTRDIPISFHALRHSHASQLLKQGASVKVVSERLGHSSTVLTMTTYAHVLQGMQEDATDRFGDALDQALDRQRAANPAG